MKQSASYSEMRLVAWERRKHANIRVGRHADPTTGNRQPATSQPLTCRTFSFFSSISAWSDLRSLASCFSNCSIASKSPLSTALAISPFTNNSRSAIFALHLDSSSAISFFWCQLCVLRYGLRHLKFRVNGPVFRGRRRRVGPPGGDARLQSMMLGGLLVAGLHVKQRQIGVNELFVWPKLLRPVPFGDGCGVI